ERQRITAVECVGEPMTSRILFVAKELSYEPQGVMSLAAVLKQAGHEVALTVATEEDSVARAVSCQPDILAYSVLTGSQGGYLALNERLRAALAPVRSAAGKPPVLSVFGGPHPTFFPQLIEEPGVDGVCRGEGEGALLDLADSLALGALQPEMPNWWFKLDGQIVKSQVRPLVRELSSLPRPDRALIYDRHPQLAQSPIKHFITSRGCPFDCSYCFNHALHEMYPRERRHYRRTVDDVIGEVQAVRARWPLEHVVFVDDLFIVDKVWLRELAAKWPAAVGLPFFCNVQASLLVRQPELLVLLKQAGCHTVSMGIESANDRIRNELLRRRMTQEEIVTAGRMVRAAGMVITATNILGLPTSTLEDDFATMRLNTEAGVSYAHAWLFQPYPGTELGDFARSQGLVPGTLDDLSDVAWERAALSYGSEETKTRVEQLQRFFGIGVEWLWLEPLIRRLINLPHHPVTDTLFWWVHKLHKGYAIYRRVHPVRTHPAELLKLATHFIRLRG
ncbi:MAG: B12-binding domain-containing radical SAM protein, partial [Nitrososphaerales archaeon]